MGRKLSCMDIGTSKLKVAAVRNNKLEDFKTYDIPDDIVRNSALVAYNAMSVFLKMNVSKELKTKDVAVVLPDEITFIQRTAMPIMTDKQVGVNLPYEFSNLIPENEDEYLYDYSVLSIDQEKGTMNVIAAAVRRELVDNYRDMFQHAGMNIVKAVPKAVCLQKFVRNCLPEGKDTAILDIGYCASKIDIFRGGFYEVSRTIELGMRDIIAAAAKVLNCDVHVAPGYLSVNKDDVQQSRECRSIYSAITTEVSRALNYYIYENRGNTLDKLYLCGGGASFAPLADEIRESIPLALALMSEAAPEFGESVNDSPAVIGIGLEER